MPILKNFIIEPDKIYVNTSFRLKLNLDLSLKCSDVKNAGLKCNIAKNYKCYEYTIGGKK